MTRSPWPSSLSKPMRISVATQAANLGEYLTHERRVLVPQAEAREFIDGVDALREQADRLEARVKALESVEQPT